jgi:hypothetical protein
LGDDQLNNDLENVLDWFKDYGAAVIAVPSVYSHIEVMASDGWRFQVYDQIHVLHPSAEAYVYLLETSTTCQPSQWSFKPP